LTPIDWGPYPITCRSSTNRLIDLVDSTVKSTSMAPDDLFGGSTAEVSRRTWPVTARSTDAALISTKWPIVERAASAKL